MRLEGKVVVITGVSKGIGLATAEALLAEGAVVAGWGRTAPDLQHPHFHFFGCDVQQAESVQEAFESTVRQLGSELPVLINNAGLGIMGAVEELSLGDWHQMMRTNVDGVFYCTRLLVPGMKQQQEGHIINISSIAGTTGIENMSAYCATKYAVRGLSQSWYKELRKFGIKVTCLFPGSVQTHFFDDIPSVITGEHMMQPHDIASTILHCLQAPRNYHHVEIEVRPLVGAPRK